MPDLTATSFATGFDGAGVIYRHLREWAVLGSNQ